MFIRISILFFCPAYKGWKNVFTCQKIWIRIERTENTATNTKLAHRKHQIGKVVFAHPKLIDT